MQIIFTLCDLLLPAVLPVVIPFWWDWEFRTAMQVITIKLHVQQAVASNDSNFATELQDFVHHLLKTGKRKTLIVTFS